MVSGFHVRPNSLISWLIPTDYTFTGQHPLPLNYNLSNWFCLSFHWRNRLCWGFTSALPRHHHTEIPRVLWWSQRAKSKGNWQLVLYPFIAAAISVTRSSKWNKLNQMHKYLTAPCSRSNFVNKIKYRVIGEWRGCYFSIFTLICCWSNECVELDCKWNSSTRNP